MRTLFGDIPMRREAGPAEVTLEEIRAAVRPMGEIYAGHPRLAREAAWSRLRNKPMWEIEILCRMLHTNIEGLVDLLERKRIILTGPEIQPRQSDEGNFFK
jgi:hypothetical protein